MVALTVDQLAYKDEGADKWQAVVPKAQVASVVSKSATEFLVTFKDEQTLLLKAASQSEADSWVSALSAWLAEPLPAVTVTPPSSASETANPTPADIKVAEAVTVVQADAVVSPGPTTSSSQAQAATTTTDATTAAAVTAIVASTTTPVVERRWYELWAGCCQAE